MKSLVLVFKIILPVLAITLLSENVKAQLVTDALRYGHFEPLGTARSAGISNTFSSIGGDFSSMSQNPAGLAVYRSSEWTITPTVKAHNNSATFNSNATSTKSTLSDFSFSNFGLVITHNPSSRNWKTFNFAIGFNQLNNFDRQIKYNGSSIGSISDRWLDQAQNIALDDLSALESGLAYDVGVLLKVEDENLYQSDYRNDEINNGTASELNKREILTQEGVMGEMVFSMGTNYKDRFMFGLTVGVPTINFTEKKRYVEDDTQNKRIGTFEKLEYDENIASSGVGINAKFGMIYRISQKWRWGVNIHTRSRISLSDTFNNRISYSYLDDATSSILRFEGTYPPDDAQLNFDYVIRAPFKVGTSLGMIIGKSGFVSADVSWTDISKTEFVFDPDLSSADDKLYEAELNNAIKDQFKSTIRIALGGEYALGRWKFRGGATIKENPVVGNDDLDLTWSLGSGYRFKRTFLDLGYRQARINSSYSPYLLSPDSDYSPQMITSKEVAHDFVLTFGVKF